MNGNEHKDVRWSWNGTCVGLGESSSNDLVAAAEAQDEVVLQAAVVGSGVQVLNDQSLHLLVFPLQQSLCDLCHVTLINKILFS